MPTYDPIEGNLINRYEGMTVGIYNATGGVDEYWFKNGIEDDDLIPKIPDIEFPGIENLPGNIKVAKFKANGGSGHQNSELTDDESYIHLPECVFTNDNGTFRGWDTTTASQSPKVPGTDVFLSQSTTFYAIWDNIISYTVIFDDTVIACTFNGTAIPNGSSVASGSTVVFTYANQAANKAFSSWTGFQTTDSVSYGQNPETATIQVTRNLNIDCIEVTLYQLTISNALEHGSLTLNVNAAGAAPAPSSIWLAPNSQVEIQYAPNTNGWGISQWNCSGVAPTSSTDTILKFTMPSGNVSVSPQEQQTSTSFTIKFYEYDNDASSYIGYYSSASPVTLNVAVGNMTEDGTQPGCVPTSWAAFGTTTPIADTDTLSSDTNLYILTKKYRVTATPSPKDGGTCTGDGLFDPGRPTTLTATASYGWTFTNWTLDGYSTPIADNPLLIPSINQNMSYLANFKLKPMYTISATADPTEGGTVSGGGSYQSGATATLTATANPGYKFVEWESNGSTVSMDSQYSFQVLASNNYTAKFTEITYTISATADPTEGGTVSGGSSYPSGATATLTATANPGYKFVEWELNGSTVSSDNPYSFQVFASNNYTAKFTEITKYTVAVTVNPSNAGTVSGDGQYYANQSAMLIATPAEGYHFAKWTENNVDVSTANPYTFTVTDNRTLVAQFEENAPDEVNVIVLSGAQKYASLLQDYLDQGKITATHHNITVGATSGKLNIPINTADDSRDINGCVILFNNGYNITTANLLDDDNKILTCEKSLGRPRSSSDSTQQTTFMYNNTEYNGYALYQYRLIPAKIEFTIVNN